MRIYAGFSVAMAFGLTGCASIPIGLPRPPSTDGISVPAITLALQCEMANAYSHVARSEQAKTNPALGRELDDYAAGVKLELKVREQNVLGSAAKLVVPIMPVKFDSLTVNLGPSLDDTAYRYTTLNFNVAMKDLKGKFLDKGGEPGARCTPESTGFEPAQGSLGLGDWIAESVLALNGKSEAADLDNMSYLLEFILIRDAQGGVAFASNRLQNLGVTADSKRTRDNTITVSIAKVPGPPKPQHIVVDNQIAIANQRDEAGNRPQPARPRYQTPFSLSPPAQNPSKTGLSLETKQRLEFLNNQQKFNSVISPNSQIIPY
jgi:hypothetical protein